MSGRGSCSGEKDAMARADGQPRGERSARRATGEAERRSQGEKRLPLPFVQSASRFSAAGQKSHAPSAQERERKRL